MERITWTDELIESQIRFVMSALGIERMPSNSEIIEGGKMAFKDIIDIIIPPVTIFVIMGNWKWQVNYIP